MYRNIFWPIGSLELLCYYCLCHFVDILIVHDIGTTFDTETHELNTISFLKSSPYSYFKILLSGRLSLYLSICLSLSVSD